MTKLAVGDVIKAHGREYKVSHIYCSHGSDNPVFLAVPKRKNGKWQKAEHIIWSDVSYTKEATHGQEN